MNKPKEIINGRKPLVENLPEDLEETEKQLAVASWNKKEKGNEKENNNAQN